MESDELIRLVNPYTGLKAPSLKKLYDFVDGHDLPPGAVVQCGVVNGGSAVLLWHACGGGERDLWMFDSWEGMPPPGDKDGGKAGSKYNFHMAAHGAWCKGDIEKAREIARLAGVPAGQTKAIAGWFSDTLPEWSGKIGAIAMLHLDADWYQSTIECLEYLYPQLAAGGLLILDDYGHWDGCKVACQEYGIDELLTVTPPCGAYLVKEN